MQRNRQPITINTVQNRRNVTGLAGLLDRIGKTEGPINPNDRATARIFADFLKEQETVTRTSDRNDH